MDNNDFAFNLLGTDGSARRGRITMPRGTIETPTFMPVGTAGTVKGIYTNQLVECGSQIILGNTYHLMLRPGAERVQHLGGLHKLMNWEKPILTDSGGFQVMSLSSLTKIREEGVIFRSHIDGAKYDLTPERSIEIQILLDSNIIMQLDECIRLPAESSEIERAMLLSLRWAERCKTHFEKLARAGDGRALFGIVQGGTNYSLRRRSAESLVALNLPGYAIGGLAVGEPQSEMLTTIEHTTPFLPKEKPRYLMGVGTPDDLLKAIARGIDMFDCVMPTRSGRHGTIYTRFGKFNLRNAKFADDIRPIDETSDCPATKDYSRGYLHHLVKSGESLGQMLLSWHNLAYYQYLMREARKAIEENRYDDFMLKTKEMWEKGDK